MNPAHAPRADLHQDLHDLAGPIVLCGAGKMGGALLEGWLQAGLAPERIAVIEPDPAPAIAALGARGVRLNPDATAIAEAAAIVIAVKPQIAAAALPALAPAIGPATVVISIMAGRTLQFLADTLPRARALVRAMPNTPAAIGRGITVAVPRHVSDAQRDLAHRLLIASGTVEWIADEALMDAVTAVSGSGPAYVFLLAEALAEAGMAAGLAGAGLAEKLARETVAGAGEFAAPLGAPAATLRGERHVAEGGTTAAALDVVMRADGLPPLLKEAIAAATQRSRKLAGSLAPALVPASN